MQEIKLYTARGEYVATVLVPPFLQGAGPEVLVWGQRYFLVRADGHFYECFALPVFTMQELHDGAQQGLVT